MQRLVLDESRIHPAAREAIAANHRDIIEEVEAACRQHDIVVVGMAQNPFPKKARKLLDEAGLPYHYLEYGSYFGSWRRRNALKMWAGWPTFPMVFVKGTLIGGFTELHRVLAKGELKTLVAAATA